jgi:hypothetical protein
VLFSSNEFTLLKGEKYKCVSLKKINNELLILLFGQNINKILNIEVDICGIFITKHWLNKKHLIMFI